MKNEMAFLAGRRLLLLGGTRQTCDAVETAHEMGVVVYVADYYDDPSLSPAKCMADRAFTISTHDVEGILGLIRGEKIDGVMTVANEEIFPYYYEICRRSGLPCYLTPETIAAFTRKDTFKTLLRRHGLAAIPQFPLSDPPTPQELDTLVYPILVKPADSSASRGVAACYAPGEVDGAIRRAKEASQSGRFLAERMMRCDDVIINYTFRGGDYRLCQMGDRHALWPDPRCGSVTGTLVYPSVHLDAFIENTHPLLCRLFRDVGVRDGVMFIQAFFEDGRFYCYDVGYRTCGAQVYFMQKAANNLPQMEMLICHALSGSMGPAEWMERCDPRFSGKVGCNQALLIRPGRICAVEGLDAVRSHPGVIRLTQFAGLGHTVTQAQQGTLKQTFARLHYLCGDRDELRKAMEFVMSQVKVLDEHGENMLIGPAAAPCAG